MVGVGIRSGVHVVQVDRLGQRQEALGIEALDETAPLMLQVILDRKMEAVLAQLGAAAEAAGELAAATVGGDRQLARQRQASSTLPLAWPSRTMPRCTLRWAVVSGCGRCAPASSTRRSTQRGCRAANARPTIAP